MEELRAWEVTCCGITATVFATSRARAGFMVVNSARDSGYAGNFKKAFQTLRTRRAPWDDVLALSHGREGYKP